MFHYNLLLFLSLLLNNLKVPLFINIGDRVKVDTATGAYVERVKG